MLKQVFSRDAKGRAKIIGIAGSTCTGKTTLAEELVKELTKNGLAVQLIGQDKFYKQKESVNTLKNSKEPSITFYNYDDIQALEEAEMLRAIRRHSGTVDVVLVEGNMITDLDLFFAEIGWTLFFTIDKETCRSRHILREYDPPDEIGYFDQVVWPAYEATLAKAKTSGKSIAFVNSSDKHITLESVIAEFQHLICDQIELTTNVIDSKKAENWVNHPSCGANSIFIGTTRDTFGDKTVKNLEYETYPEMAISELEKLCKETRKNHQTVLRICIYHRLGKVPIGEASVIVATSAPQREAANKATAWLIDALKERAPIWKKELYTDGSYSWKENVEQPKPSRI